jgi:TonB family protein
MTAQTLRKADADATPASQYKPDWLRKPSSEDMAWAYPQRAQREEIGGKAVLHCLVAPDGGLTHCQVASEAPADYGFGAAALALAPQFQMTRPPSDAKNPSEVTIPISFLTPSSGPAPESDAAAANPETQAPETPAPQTPSPLAVVISHGRDWVADHARAQPGPLTAMAAVLILVVLAGVALRRWSRRADGKDLTGPNSERR